MPEVFISYGRKNRELVEPLAARLKELGVTCWMDSGIQAGDRYRREIRSQLKDAKAVLVCWTPDALDSDWVDYEADISLEYETYVPVYLAPCALQPPFSGFQTPDLAKWHGEPADPDWLMLIEKIGEKIGRQGVTAAACAMASSDEQARYDFAKRYPEEPLAQKLWLTFEAAHREAFNQRMNEARNKVRARINQEYSDLDARLAASVPALNAWLTEEQRNAAREPRPDPSDIIESRDGADETKWRLEVASLSNGLATAKGHEEQLRIEVKRLSRELAEGLEETKRLRGESMSLRLDLGSVKGEMERISEERETIVRDNAKLRAQNETLAEDVEACTLELDAIKGRAKADKQELEAANALIAHLSTQLASTNRAGSVGVNTGAEKSPNTARAAPATEESKLAPAAEKTSLSKPATKSKFWTVTWPIGFGLSIILGIMFISAVNSSSYSAKSQAGPIFYLLIITLFFSIIAYRRSRARKAVQ